MIRYDYLTSGCMTFVYFNVVAKCFFAVFFFFIGFVFNQIWYPANSVFVRSLPLTGLLYYCFGIVSFPPLVETNQCLGLHWYLA